MKLAQIQKWGGDVINYKTMRIARWRSVVQNSLQNELLVLLGKTISPAAKLVVYEIVVKTRVLFLFLAIPRTFDDYLAGERPTKVACFFFSF